MDIYEMRMVSTYVGQGTMWLTQDNVNDLALQQGGDNEAIVRNEADIQQLDPYDVAILKGALHPNCDNGGIVHRSPAIENGNQKRIFLRVDGLSLMEHTH